MLFLRSKRNKKLMQVVWSIVGTLIAVSMIALYALPFLGQ